MLLHNLVSDSVLNGGVAKSSSSDQAFWKEEFVIINLNCVHRESSCSSFEFDLSLPNFPRAIGQIVKSSTTIALKYLIDTFKNSI